MARLFSIFHSPLGATYRKPVIPVPNISWPLYTVQGRQILYMQPNNYTVARDSDQDHCDIWRPFLLKKCVWFFYYFDAEIAIFIK